MEGAERPQLEVKISDAKYSRGREIERSSKVFMRRLVPKDKPLRILDVGCGTGLNAEHLVAAGHHVTGIDVSPVAIERFRQTGLTGLVADISQGVPFETGSFDLVYASEVIEHVTDTESFLAEIGRVLRPGGTLLLSTPNSAWWAYRALGLIGKTVSQVQHPGHVRFFSPASLRGHLLQAGFGPVEMSARHMYAAVTLSLPESVGRALETVGFQRERRFKTGRDFWQLSRFAHRANALWADTLIVAATRAPEAAAASVASRIEPAT